MAGASNCQELTLGKHCWQQCLAATLPGIKPSITGFVVQHANQLATGDHSKGTFLNIFLTLFFCTALYIKALSLTCTRSFIPTLDKTISLDFRPMIVHLTNASILSMSTPPLMSPGLSKGCWHLYMVIVYTNSQEMFLKFLTNF